MIKRRAELNADISFKERVRWGEPMAHLACFLRQSLFSADDAGRSFKEALVPGWPDVRLFST